MDDLHKKFKKLKEYIKSLNSVAVAFSSGVDSTFLLKVCSMLLKENCVAFTAKSCSFPERELNEAIEFCKKENIKHIIFNSEELDIDGFSNNPVNRCYLCKKELFKKIQKISKENNIENIVEGSNIDDLGDYRPGLEAVRELNVKSPLRYSNMTKAEIRELSKELGLDTYKKQSFACLSSRFVYGEKITKEKLKMVELAEQMLLDEGFHQVRVRIHGNIARIEIMPEEFEKLLDIRKKINYEFKKLGFSYITMDLSGYRTGSMNETINT